MKRLCLLGLTVGVFTATQTSAMSDETIAKLRLIKFGLHSSGKGSALGWDAGVVAEAYKRIPAMKAGETLVSGSSSGAITAAFFALRGFNDASLKELNEKLVTGTPRILQSVDTLRKIGENTERKLEELKNSLVAGIDKGAETVDISNLDAYIDAVLGLPDPTEGTGSYRKALGPSDSKYIVDDSGKLKFVLPFLTVAANYEVIDVRHRNFKFTATGYIIDQLSGMNKIETRSDKEYDPLDLSFYWKEAALRDYLKNEEKFNAMNPGLVHPKNKDTDPHFIGKACTYFVSPDLYELLSEQPWKELLCDLRIVETYHDLVHAIRGPIAEPTFFAPTEEDNLARIRAEGKEGYAGSSKERKYYGAFLMPFAGQCLRRALPGIRLMGTGFVRLPDAAASILASLTLVDLREIEKRNIYWEDIEMEPINEDAEMIRKKKGTQDQHFQAGLKRTKFCLDEEAKALAQGKSNSVCVPTKSKIKDPKEAGGLSDKKPDYLKRAAKDGAKKRDFSRPFPNYVADDSFKDESGNPIGSETPLKGGRGLGSLLKL